MTIASGTQLGSYEVLSSLGAGGMGEVYRARDTKLDRDVAVKVLPAQFANDPEALARFEREARAVAALSHPNILAIFDFGRQDDRVYAVMELLDGESLRERLLEGALPARKTIEYAVQLAHGLAAAHEKGVVHRDLKPENVFVTREGRVKILDFGLAWRRPLDAAGREQTAAGQHPMAQNDLTAVPTVMGSPNLTEPGTVMGTVGYMSPEQVRGRAADHRSDIFSLGAVLYEMLSGRRAFRGESAAETMAAIAQKDPPDLSGGQFPPALERIVRHCLEKNPNERFQSARDLAFDLESLTTASGAAAAAAAVAGPPSSPARRRLLFSGIGVLGLVAAFALGRWARSAPESAPASVAGGFTQLTDLPGVEREPALAPDGKSFLYVSDASGNDDIYSLRVGGRNPVNLTKDSAASDESPAFSPDGEQIAFRSERDGGGIYVMGATGESVRRVTEFGFDPDWSPDKSELVVASEPVKDPTSRATTSQVFAVKVAGGEKRLLSRGDCIGPRWSPHGHRIACWGLPAGAAERDIFTVAADGSEAKAAPVPVTRDPDFDWSPAWSPDGRFLYFSSNRGGTMNLWRVPIDEKSGRTLGPPEPMTTPSARASGFSFSKDGRTLAFATLEERTSLMKIAFDPEREAAVGAPAVILRGARLYSSLDWSPEGRSLVFVAPRGQREDLFVVQADGTGYRQLTDAPFQHRAPRFSPDGSRIGFYSNRQGGKAQIWTIRPDGSGLKQLTRLAEGALYLAWSPEGTRLAVLSSQTAGGPRNATAVVDIAHTPAQTPVLWLPTVDDPWSWSRDGKLLAGYTTRPDRSSDVTVHSLETGKDTVIGPGQGPIFLSDSRRLLYVNRGGILHYDMRTGKSHAVLPAGTVASAWAQSFSLSADNRWIAFLDTNREGDIWMMTLAPPRTTRRDDPQGLNAMRTTINRRPADGAAVMASSERR